MREKQKGITLIALVITIIVLLILAGVSIATLTGKNGVLSQADNAKEETNSATDLEQVKLGVTVGVSENLTSGKDINAAIQEELRKTDTNATVIGEDDEKDVTYNNKNYKVNIKTGSITESIVDQTEIFTYTDDGYITGVKEEYIEEVTQRKTAVINSKKYASINNNGIKVALYQDPEIIYYLKEEVGTVLNIPSEINGITITGIAPRAFYAIYNLEEVLIPSTIEEIGDYAFNCCIVLQKAHLSEGLKKIGISAFEDCFELTEIDIPSTVTDIGSHCFYQIGKTEMFIPKGVINIGSMAFPYMDKIYCEIESKPDTWASNWNYGLYQPSPVEWGVSKQN